MSAGIVPGYDFNRELLGADEKLFFGIAGAFPEKRKSSKLGEF
jgi:hypothetical protein